MRPSLLRFILKVHFEVNIFYDETVSPTFQIPLAKNVAFSSSIAAIKCRDWGDLIEAEYGNCS